MLRNKEARTLDSEQIIIQTFNFSDIVFTPPAESSQRATKTKHKTDGALSRIFSFVFKLYLFLSWNGRFGAKRFHICQVIVRSSLTRAR
ncbi:hypothetical protein L6164_011150 [Bauhinia variegata]|uniref:Uncharacterized protein n=1 Tax=Bauhinia variegata TaxID=167791 RepID=A0ACB9P7B7_BAUVA|nr:hypothetical protein L6164_011150 [Bauhinia variegata]